MFERHAGLRRCISIVATATLLAACGASEEAVRAEFDEELNRSNSCEAASDCVLISPGCPLGCWAFVNSAHQARVERKAEELIDDYQWGGARCDYECTEAPTPDCIANKCTAAEP